MTRTNRSAKHGKRRPAGPAPEPAHALTGLPRSAGVRAAGEPAFWLLLAIMAVYAALAWVTTGQAERWVLAVIDGQQLFAIDDAYRYYLARTAWTDPTLYAWSYVLPVASLVDGLLASLVSGDLYLMRTLHVLAAFATLWLTLLTGMRLGAGRIAMTVSILLLACMPLFAFGFLSFYAENWLALALVAGAFLFVSGRERAAAATFALLPLIRPEGIFLIAPLGVFWLLRRRLDLLALLGGPGFLYGVYLLAVLDRVGDYTLWRLELLDILQHAKDAGMRRAWGFFDVFNLLWTGPALAAFCLPALRGAWPVFAGGALWLVAAILFVATGNSFFEARYFLSILPLLAIAWPFFFSWLGARLQWRAGTTLAVFLCLAAFVTAEHFLQLDPVKAAWGNHRWPVPGIPAARGYFGTLSPKAIATRQQTADAIANVVAGNPAVDRVLVTNTELYYHLDPRIAAQARVIYVPTNEAIADAWLGGAYFGLHPGGTQFGYYRLRAPRPDDRHLALFVGRLSAPDFPAVYQRGIFAIYLVAFDVTQRNDAVAAPPTAMTP